MTPDVHALEELLRYTFGDKNHLICAVSTSALAATMAGAKGSLIGEKTLPAESNGRMALLGASVLRVLITDGAFRNGKTKAEIDADIKSTAGIDNLHTVGIASGLQNHLVRNPGDQGEVSKKTMAQSIGAIIGAAFLDGGMDAATKVADALGQKNSIRLRTERAYTDLLRPRWKVSVSPHQSSAAFPKPTATHTLHLTSAKHYDVYTLYYRFAGAHRCNKDVCGLQGATTLPPGYRARIGYLKTFHLPFRITGSLKDRELGERIIQALREDGIFQVALPAEKSELIQAFSESKKFFDQPLSEKERLVDDQSFSGYVASSEELTNGVRDYSEIFTVTRDLHEDDGRVQDLWPCHGPCPWPNEGFKKAIVDLTSMFEEYGDALLQLIAYGLRLEDETALHRITQDGWHHMRVLRFPSLTSTNGKGEQGRGIGSHTDYGLLVLAAQDEVGGLFIRPPNPDEAIANWKTSTAGAYENDDNWVYVPPMPNVITVFTGNMMQHMTNSHLPSTLHKVALNTKERFAFAYFHEPNFSAQVKLLPQFADGKKTEGSEAICYGRHFTNMAMRNYPERITAQRMMREERISKLDEISKAPYPYLNGVNGENC